MCFSPAGMHQCGTKVTIVQFVALRFLESQYFPAGWSFGLFPASQYILPDDPDCATGADTSVNYTPENKKK